MINVFADVVQIIVFSAGADAFLSVDNSHKRPRCCSHVCQSEMNCIKTESTTWEYAGGINDL
uniref:Uncharacterized protein n=1 Tax=Romanomermis culicivorax TaxID=13658 RepID=A0A915I301_ROMCU